ncbi:hypothetical protein DL764_001501 [Monosporascus ibericus]|uniref:NB-ARC domain-containing protein n=1 Tax=Monosporascus ibericus TaxID=155417 RepID=A0A4Q4TU14_9PEZI|nr:hypothetical protein DL764_001501 [Monosporascus ibericus]
MGSINKQISRYETTAVYTHPDAKVDIVLVHGLNGDPQKTWTAKNGVFWPADLLPTSLRDARANILVYGYNADVYSKKHGSHPSDNFIFLHAQTLVTSLTHYRKDEQTAHNPIIWVCHSLGGILTKRALLYSNDVKASQHEDYRSIYVSTYGIVFLGTPHTGSDMAAWGTVLQAMSDAVVPKSFFQSESVLLKTLKRDNETLQNINNHFLDIYQRFKIMMAHENHKTDLKGTRMLIVDANSAGPQLPGVTYYAIEATHSGMCKFESKNAPGYRTIVTAIRDWVGEAPDVIATRWRVEDEEKLARAKHEIEERMKPWVGRYPFGMGCSSAERKKADGAQIQSQRLAQSAHGSSSRLPPILPIDIEADYGYGSGTPVEDVVFPFEIEEMEDHGVEASPQNQINETTSPLPPRSPSRLDGESKPLLPAPEGDPPPEQSEPSSQQSTSDHAASQEPIFVKPAVFRPNTFFKGREKELKQLHKMLTDRGRRSSGTSSVLIQSMPGGGKSHLARQYVFQHRTDYPGGIFWIRAKSVKELEYGYWDIAETAGLSDIRDLDRDDEQTTRRMVAAVRAWLNTTKDWLLILDGIHFDFPDLQYYIPFAKDTSIIFTSTERTVAEDYQFDNPQVIALDSLSKQEAQELLLEEMGKKKPWTQDDLSRASELVELMDRLPLMIHVAALHLKATREPLAKYVRSFKNRPRAGNLPAYQEVRKQLQHRGAVAALNLMYMLSFFGQHIPVEMVALGAKALGRSTPIKSSSPDNRRTSLNNTFQVLIAFALMERYQNNEASSASSRSLRSIDMGQDNLDILRVHGIVQAFFVDVLANEKEAPFWLEQAISVFCRAFDESKRRIQADPQTGMPQDFRRFRIHGERLTEHLDRFQRRAPERLGPWRLRLDSCLNSITDLIDQLRKRNSAVHSRSSKDVVISVFERTNSLSEAESSTPPSSNSVLEFYTEENTPLHSPTIYTPGDFNPYHWHVTYPCGIPYTAEDELDISRTVTPQPAPTEIFEAISMPDDDETTRRVFGPNHRTIKRHAARRYRDHAGAWRASPQVVSDPRVSISRETAKGLISASSGHGAVSPHASSDDSGAAGSEAEVALNHIRQATPLAPHIETISANEREPMQRPKLMAGRTSYASASASETSPTEDHPITPTFSNVIGTCPAPSSSYTAATIMRLKENERPVPVEGLAPVKVSSPLAGEPITTTSLRAPSPPSTQEIPETDSFDFLERPPPMPASRTTKSSPSQHTSPFSPPPIPIEVHSTSSLRASPSAGLRASFGLYGGMPEHEVGDEPLTRSLPTMKSYPSLPYPHNDAAASASSARHPGPDGFSMPVHVHPPPWAASPPNAQGYSSQPMSRDPSHQSSRSQGSHANSDRGAPQPPRGSSGGSPAHGSSPGPQAMRRPRSRRPSVVETEPSPRIEALDAFGIDPVVTSYQLYGENARGRRRTGSGSGSGLGGGDGELPYPATRESGFLARWRNRRRAGGSGSGSSGNGRPGGSGGRPLSSDGDGDGDDESTGGSITAGNGGNGNGNGKNGKGKDKERRSSHRRAISAGGRLVRLRGKHKSLDSFGDNASSAPSVPVPVPVPGSADGADMARSPSGGIRLADGKMVEFGGTGPGLARAPPPPQPQSLPGAGAGVSRAGGRSGAGSPLRNSNSLVGLGIQQHRPRS